MESYFELYQRYLTCSRGFVLKKILQRMLFKNKMQFYFFLGVAILASMTIFASSLLSIKSHWLSGIFLLFGVNFFFAMRLLEKAEKQFLSVFYSNGFPKAIKPLEQEKWLRYFLFSQWLSEQMHGKEKARRALEFLKIELAAVSPRRFFEHPMVWFIMGLVLNYLLTYGKKLSLSLVFAMAIFIIWAFTFGCFGLLDSVQTLKKKYELKGFLEHFLAEAKSH